MESGRYRRGTKIRIRQPVLLVLAAALIAPLPGILSAEARRPAAGETFDRAFADWMRRHGSARAVLAVSRGEYLLLARGYGGLDPHQPVPLASLSKAITAVCVAVLVREGKLRYDSRLGTVLEPYFRRHGGPADPRVRAITIEQLLAHRSGFSRKANPDPASGPALEALLRERSADEPHLEVALTRALTYRLARAPGSAYEYVNVNYLVLGAAIEAAAERPYEVYCRETVLQPLGIATARLGPKWAALSAYGGWSMSGPDYLLFLSAFDRKAGVIDAKGRSWMMSAAGKRIEGHPELHYALGMVVRRDREGPSLWHTGLWTHAQRDAKSGFLSDSHATLAVKSARGFAWFAYVEPQPSRAARAALDAVLWRAAERTAPSQRR
jgi:CubicO group peptidase (beta-lactamase class C family)